MREMGNYCRSIRPRVQHGLIPKGYRGTMETVRQICRLIREGAKDLCVRRHAINIFKAYDVKPKDHLREILALFDWVRTNVRYTKDIFRVELLHSARRLLEFRAGDCDDQVILLGSMLEATGHPVRLILVGSDLTRPHRFSHILLEVSHKGRWISLDPTMDRPPGWRPNAPNRKVIDIRRPFGAGRGARPG